MRISIIGTGYVGLVTGACLSDFGLQVICVDKDKKKIEQLESGKVPIYEQGLENLIKKNVAAKRLSFTTNIGDAVRQSQVVFIAVGTPSNNDGSADLSQVEEVTKEIARNLNEYKVIVNKCTVPVGTARKIKQIIEENRILNNICKVNPGDLSAYNSCKDSIVLSGSDDEPSPYNYCTNSNLKGNCQQPPISSHSENSLIPSQQKENPPNSIYQDPSSLRHFEELPSSRHCEKRSDEAISSTSARIPFDIISNPEFLREGSAVYDFTHPDKIVIGYESERAKKIMQEIYRPLYLLNTPFVFTTLETAEMIKYACNAFLATKITFINEIANLCDKVEADVHEIARAMGMDGRISPKFLHPGPGFGGSCFPKDTRALMATAHSNNYDFKLLKSVIEANLRQRKIVVDKMEEGLGILKGKTIAVLGLAFKQNTDDVRESPALEVIKILLEKGSVIKCFDPMAMENTKKIFPELIYCSNEYEAVRDSDALVILTEWNQFRNLDLIKIKKLLKSPILFDMRNLYEPLQVKEIGIKYFGIGRR
jgi:nucleotide sugar dehydrogenase